MAVSLSLFACVRYARLIIRRLALPKELRVSGAFSTDNTDPINAHVGPSHTPFEDSELTAGGLSSARPPERPAAAVRSTYWLPNSVLTYLRTSPSF
mmetsp:Transcript_63751/g.126036  ORF Transcript_63751/g.126036 Transcript_63751/m.126036 type:complete len:96 (+) Transcript_63751:644-931(+)